MSRYRNVFDRDRRQFLKVLASAGISRGLLNASPLVGGMLYSRVAEAQSGPNKSVVVYVPNGCIPEQWFPNGNLSQLRPMSQPYGGVRNECHFLRNMGHHRGGHGVAPTIINNGWGGDSFDVNMGRTIGENLPFPYVNLGVHSNGSGMLTRDNGTEVPYEDNPFNAFQRLFGNGGGGGAAAPAPVNRKVAVIDAHLEALAELRTRLGNYERQRLDAHLNAIEEVEERLIRSTSPPSAPPPASCGTSSPGRFGLNYDNFRRQAELQADIMVLALRCNLTASCSLGLGNDSGEFTLPGLGFSGVYHQSIHGGNGGDSSYPHFRETRAFLSSLSAYLIDALRDADLLDTTIFCEVSDMGNGDSHSSNNVPLIMAGGGGRIRRGVSSAGGGGYTPLHMIHTAAVALNADQHPNYQGYANDVIPGLLA